MPYDREKSIRELGGEVWAEARKLDGADAHWELVGQFVEVMMGVLARHAGTVIRNDPDVPVEPLGAAPGETV